MKKFDVAVVGGGAGGLACTVRLTENSNLKVAVIEACERIGKKLAATGNGQGNVSNLDMGAEHYFGGNINLVKKIACADPFAGAGLFDCLFTADEKGRIYPAGRQASALCDGFLKKLSGKAELLLSTPVNGAKKRGGEFALQTDGGEISARFLVICTGGLAQPSAKNNPYALAEGFGHTLTPLYPSLVQLKTDTAHIKNLRGIRADCAVTAYVGDKKIKTVRGDVIFTEYGISGNAVFLLSSYVADRQGVTLSLEFLPDIPEEAVSAILKKRRAAGYADGELLSGTLHNQIGRAIIARSGGKDGEILRVLKNFALRMKGTLGFAYAQVTRGGINMEEISDGLESKLVQNLFFAGEILDVDGECGGYNLQWAFTSGMAAADEIIRRTGND